MGLFSAGNMTPSWAKPAVPTNSKATLPIPWRKPQQPSFGQAQQPFQIQSGITTTHQLIPDAITQKSQNQAMAIPGVSMQGAAPGVSATSPAFQTQLMRAQANARAGAMQNAAGIGFADRVANAQHRLATQGARAEDVLGKMISYNTFDQANRDYFSDIRGMYMNVLLQQLANAQRNGMIPTSSSLLGNLF